MAIDLMTENVDTLILQPDVILLISAELYFGEQNTNLCSMEICWEANSTNFQHGWKL